MRATELSYTEKELAAIEALRANAGEWLSAKDLGVANVTLTGLMTKAAKFPEADGVVIIEKRDSEEKVCPTCGAVIPSHKEYRIVR